MDEVDAFIKEQCRKLECSFVDEADNDELDFDTHNVFEFLIRCIWKIDESSKKDLPTYELPPHLANRFRVATTISDYLKKFDVRGDIGFQNLLYGSTNNLRKVFIELLHKLPNEQDDEEAKHKDTGEDHIREPSWVPEFCSRLKMSYDGRFWCPGEGDFFELLSRGQWLFESDDPRNWIAEALEDQSKTAEVKRVKPALPPKPANLSAMSEQERARQEELEAKRALLERLIHELNEMRRKFVEANIEFAKTKEDSKQLGKKIADFDPRLLEALENPAFYKSQVAKKLEALNEKAEAESDAVREAKADAEKRLAELLRQLNIDDEDKLRTVRDKIIELLRKAEELRASAADDELLIAKMEKRAAKIQNEDFSLMDRRCREMEATISAQEKGIQQLRKERRDLMKKHGRMSDALRRSLDTINSALDTTLSDNEHSYRCQQALDLFSRTEMWCIDIISVIRHIGTVKSAIHQLRDEIEMERQNKFTELENQLDEDIGEVERENEMLRSAIRSQFPDVPIPV